MRRLLILAAIALTGAAPAPAYVSFLACPIARDTGPDTDLCFLAEYQGRQYALTNPSDFGQPQLKHQVLVEARVLDGPPVCGATPLEGRVSVMAELDDACNQVLPYDGSVKGAAGGIFYSGPPEQRAAAQDLARRAVLDPRLSVQPVLPEALPAAPPQPPYAEQSLDIYYPFDSDRASGPDMLALTNLVAYAKAAGARTVTVGSQAGVSLLSSNERLAEAGGMAERRAEKLKGIMTGLGLAPQTIQIRDTLPPPPTGIEDWKARRVSIVVTP
ncbi:MAG: hypothetical protein JWM33_1686 [Caulobacteraceae bacterium]|nr:hypothetical protein [Caulobacteraceae bacterium]